MEQIKYKDFNYYIQEETPEALTLTRMDEDLKEPEIVKVNLSTSAHLLELSDERFIVGKMYYKPFNWEAIESLSKSSNTKKRSFKYS